MADSDDGFDLRSLLAAVEEAAPLDVVDVLGRELVRMAGAAHVGLLIANFSGSALVRLSHVTGAGRAQDGFNERTDKLPLPGTLYEEILFSQVLKVVPQGDAWLALVPVTERGDAIGVLEVSFDQEPSRTLLDYLVAAAHALAYVLIASRRHTDLFEWAQRDIPFSVSAEIQRRLLPSAYTAEAGPLSLAGWLEPSHDVGGDTFDYSLNRELLYLSLTDAMGHSIDAAMLATLTVGTLRNHRRALAPPTKQADEANLELQRHATQDQFVTGLIIRIRLADGVMEVVNAGHPAPFLLRNGKISLMALTAHPPLGIASEPYRSDSFALETGDRLLLITDGYLEGRADRVDIEEILTSTRDRHPRQIVQELARRVLAVTGGRLRDDATALCIDWYGPAGDRDATGGASRARATTS